MKEAFGRRVNGRCIHRVRRVEDRGVWLWISVTLSADAHCLASSTPLLSPQQQPSASPSVPARLPCEASALHHSRLVPHQRTSVRLKNKTQLNLART